ncbi:CRE-STR-183 protein [Caenorhabditis remanei]|uniref:CRE-STR-183 protein n=1 Tax=Caenorhabditis remanei TaxID=31234 RepID=E3MZ78_CAERE|nr:CRE-STR-183 protein [Caenorhabditis remanei]
MSTAWLSIQNRIQHVSTAISFFLNSILIYLILVYSPKKIGTYKYLMVYISFFQMFYSIMDNVSLPVYHTVSSVFVVFKDIHEEDYLPVPLYYWLLVVYTGCYGFCMAIFGIHFFYRFLAIYGNRNSNRGDDCGINLCTSNSFSDVIYYHLQVTSLTAIFYFGSRCYYKIQEQLKVAISVSRITKNLHRQLFYALVMQTAIPIMLLHVPVSGLFMFPIMDSDLGFLTGFVTITIAIYPAIDPLPTMLVIENYRKAVFAFFKAVFCCKHGNNSGRAEQTSSFTEGQISMATCN